MTSTLRSPEASWVVLDPDVLDVAATIAATEPQIAAAPINPAAIRPVVAIHWALREKREPEMRTL